MKKIKKTPIAKAVDLVGGQSEMARRVTRISGKKVSPQSVQQWVASGHVPDRRVLAVEAATTSQVTRYELRPDLYPTETEAA